jgi:hypothetical protein
MARKLPDDPGKRRVQQIKRIYQHLEHFRALMEDGHMPVPGIVTIPETGEEIYLSDLMVGIDSLPPRQREAFELICLQEWTETDATKKMLPDSKWSTPVQQYADTALGRMIAAYDVYQETGQTPDPYKERRRNHKDSEAQNLINGWKRGNPRCHDADEPLRKKNGSLINS